MNVLVTGLKHDSSSQKLLEEQFWTQLVSLYILTYYIARLRDPARCQRGMIDDIWARSFAF